MSNEIFDGRVSGWPEHWTNGGTGITKFPVEQRPLYEAAIKESGRDDLWLKGNELHRNGRQDTGSFWDVFRRLEAKQELEESAPRNEVLDGN